MLSSVNKLLTAAALLSAALVAGGSSAADFPRKGRTITIIVPYAAGGGVDVSARMMAEKLGERFGVSVVVENVPGASTQIGLQKLLRAPADGYTLGYSVLQTVVANYLDPSRHSPLRRELFQPIAIHHLLPSITAVAATSPIKSVNDLVEEAKKRPGEIVIGNSGLFGIAHVSILLLERATGAQFNSVPFNGGAPAVQALLGGHTQVLGGAVNDALSYIRSGEFRVLGVAAEERSPFLPDVPTYAEQGYPIVSPAYTGIVAPAGTPADIVETLTIAVKEIIATPAHTDKLRRMGLQEDYMTPAEYTDLWIKTEERIKSIIDKLRRD